MWDASTGELIFQVDRKSLFSGNKQVEPHPTLENGPENLSSSKIDNFPKISRNINTDFSNSPQMSPKSKVDFDKSYYYFYSNHNFDAQLKMDNINNISNTVKSRSKDNTRTNNSLESDCLIDCNNSNSELFTRQCSECDIELSQIWCVDYLDNLIVAGCADGRLEFWEVNTNKLKVILVFYGKVYFSD